jgi:hypothetical protein
MPVKEALFWVGLTVFGTGLYFTVEKGNVRLSYAIMLLVVGALAVVYPVLRHHYPDKKLPAIRAWLLLLIITWCAVGYDVYARYVEPLKVAEKIVEKTIPCPQQSQSKGAVPEEPRVKKSAQPPTPSPSSAQSPATINNAPNGFAISGGNVVSPTVNNLTSRPDPTFTWTQQAGEIQDGNSTTIVKIHVNGPMDFPAFAVYCDRPCSTAKDARITHPLESSQAQYFLPRRNAVLACFEFLIPQTLPADADVVWELRSAEAGSLRIVKVERYPFGQADKLP